jgi:hypothetical protein
MEQERTLVTGAPRTDSEPVIHVPSDVSTHRRAEFNPEENPTLFIAGRANDFRTRWESIQTSFVDDPRKAVEAADNLVTEVVRELTESFSKARGDLESQWAHGDGDSSTETLRIALQRYRSFFNRMLAM